MECKFNPKMVVLFVAAIIFLYFVISGSLLTIFMYESFSNSDSDSFNGEISSCAPIENNINNGEKAIVVLHADFCGWCKRMIPAWNEFYSEANGSEFGGSKVNLYAIEAKKTHVTDDFKSKFGFQSKGFPTIVKLNKANGKLNLVEFQGERTVEEFKSFCE
tara:strand:- start:22808 stop:23290 length:483 start_codon:yes stop_codon:yes gene_type:complete